MIQLDRGLYAEVPTPERLWQQEQQTNVPNRPHPSEDGSLMKLIGAVQNSNIQMNQMEENGEGLFERYTQVAEMNEGQYSFLRPEGKVGEQKEKEYGEGQI